MGFLDKLKPKPVSIDDVLACVAEVQSTDDGYDFLILRPTAGMKQLLVEKYGSDALSEDGLDQGRTIRLSLRGEEAKTFHELYKVAESSGREEGFLDAIRKALQTGEHNNKLFYAELQGDPITHHDGSITGTFSGKKSWIEDAIFTRFPKAKRETPVVSSNPSDRADHIAAIPITLVGEEAARFMKEHKAYKEPPKAIPGR